MKEYRIDIFINGTKEIRYFDNEKHARNAGHEAKRDGARAVFLLKHCIDNKYEVVTEF